MNERLTGNNILKFEPGQIKRSYDGAMKARNNLLHHDGSKFWSKVCCICDRFIKYKDERFVLVENLLHEDVKKHLTVDEEDWEDLEVPHEARKNIKEHYTQACISRLTKTGYNYNYCIETIYMVAISSIFNLRTQ